MMLGKNRPVIDSAERLPGPITFCQGISSRCANQDAVRAAALRRRRRRARAKPRCSPRRSD